jgi:hypothetical protein
LTTGGVLFLHQLTIADNIGLSAHAFHPADLNTR